MRMQNNFSHAAGVTATMVLLLTTVGNCADAFQVPSRTFVPASATTTRGIATRTLILAAGKGFGQPTDDPPPASKSKYDTPVPDPTTTTTTTTAPAPAPAGGSKMLAELRRREAEKKDAELRAVKELRSVDETLRDDPGAAAIPEAVAMRMGQRMLPFVGIPLFGGMGAFVAFWYFATYRDTEFQPALVAFTTIALLAVGLLGITYSVMSASWDDEREGSVLGFDEFQRNVGSLREGLSRSRENALLRERMAGLPEEEIQRAISDLDKRDKRARSKDSLEEKIERQLD